MNIDNLSKEMVLEYFVPINSKAFLNGEFLIEGTAINETTTSNGHKFLGEELEMSAKTLVGVPLLKDHNNSVDSIVGKVREAKFDQGSKSIPFKAIVKDEKMQGLIRDGLLNTVSVGAHVDPKNIEETEDGDIIPHGIIFKELSLVAIPAAAGATFQIALNNAYKGLKKEIEEKELNCSECKMKFDNKMELGRHMMSKHGEMKKGMEPELQSNNSSTSYERRLTNMSEEETKISESETKNVEEKKEESIEQMIRRVIQDELKSMKQVNEQKTESIVKEKKIEEDSEEEDEDEEVEEGQKYNIESGYSSFSAVRNSYIY